MTVSILKYQRYGAAPAAAKAARRSATVAAAETSTYSTPSACLPAVDRHDRRRRARGCATPNATPNATPKAAEGGGGNAVAAWRQCAGSAQQPARPHRARRRLQQP
eukprot:gene920-biopygen4255